jgi:hypothetical protein
MSHAESPPDLPYPKLPFWRTTGLSYSSYFHHFIDALRASSLWLAVVGAFMILASLQQWSSISEVMANLAAGEPPQMPISTSLVFSGVEYILLSFAGVRKGQAYGRAARRQTRSAARRPRATRLRQARWAASLHKMRGCGSGAFYVRYTLNSGAKSNVAGCPSWV